MVTIPFEQIKKSLTEEISLDLIDRIPNKWEKVGDVLTIKVPTELSIYKEKIGEKYAEVLNCKTVMNDVGGITGIFRVPNFEIIYGSENTETIHKENGVRFKLDPQRVMFSSGNMDERIRMATVSNKNETVVDLFAGIGYFSLPMAVHSRPKRIFACEINPVSYDYLCKNIVINDVSSIVESLKGDSREVAPKNVADRVIMGYIGGTGMFLSTAFECLRNHTGIIHYHDTFSEDLFLDKALKIVQKEAEKYELKIEVLRHKLVKSYAPGISHFVFDIKIGEK